MTGVFLVPAAGEGARENVEKTLGRRLAPTRFRGLSAGSLAQAKASDGAWAWGTMPGDRDRHVHTWEAMQPGDWVLFYSEGRFPVAGRVLLREHSRPVAKRLWGVDEAGATWEYLYLMDELRWIDAPRLAVLSALRYRPGFYVQGFSRVRDFSNLDAGSVEKMLDRFEATGDALKRAVEAAESGDHAAVAVAVDDPLIEEMSKGALEESIAAYTSSVPAKDREKTVRAAKRNRTLVAKLKQLYGGHCQCCGFTFAMAGGKPYSEAAHLRRISLRKRNLDTKDNLVVLCPNHHKMLDYGAIEIEYDPAADQLLLRQKGKKTKKLVNKHIGKGRPKKKK